MDTLICGMDFRCINLFSHLWHGFAIISVTLIGGMVSPQRLVFIYGMGFRRVFFFSYCLWHGFAATILTIYMVHSWHGLLPWCSIHSLFRHGLSPDSMSSFFSTLNRYNYSVQTEAAIHICAILDKFAPSRVCLAPHAYSTWWGAFVWWNFVTVYNKVVWVCLHGPLC